MLLFWRHINPAIFLASFASVRWFRRPWNKSVRSRFHFLQTIIIKVTFESRKNQGITEGRIDWEKWIHSQETFEFWKQRWVRSRPILAQNQISLAHRTRPPFFSPSPQQQINYQTSCIRWSFTTSLSPFHTAKSNYHTPILENNTNSLPLFCALIYENKEKKKKEKKEIPSTHRDTSTTGRDKWKRLT